MLIASPSVKAPADPGELPGEGNALIVAAVAHVRAVTVADLDGLMRSEGYGDREADAGALLIRGRIEHAIQARVATAPEICIERYPGAAAEVIAEMGLEGLH